MTASNPRPKIRTKRLAKDEGRVLVRAILALPTKLRHVFLLNRMAGLTYGQIGLRLGMDAEAVETALAAALVRLANRLARRKSSDKGSS